MVLKDDEFDAAPGHGAIDEVSIRAVCYFLSEQSIPVEVRSAAKWVDVRADGSAALTFERFAAESNDATARQEEFLRGLVGARAELCAAEIGKEMLIGCGAQLSLWITLYPVNGQAGVVFSADEVREWNELAAAIYIDSFGN